MQCPSCKEQIDDDSRYCDLCGEKILICSECGRPGKGKRCKFDGKELIEPGSQPAPTQVQITPQATQPDMSVQNTTEGGTTSTVTPPIRTTPPVQATPTPIQTTPPPVQTPPPVAPPIKPAQSIQQAMPSMDNDTISFIGNGNGITFEAKDGDIVGRKSGSFVTIFASQSYVSGTHCKVLKVNDSWHIQDLGSSNGTFVQGFRLVPNSPYPLMNNGTVRIATLDFIVTFTDSDSTARPN